MKMERHSKNSVVEYYQKVIQNKYTNQEHLFDDVNEEFKAIISLLESEKDIYALDLGYGYGNYTIYMAERNINVIALDLIDKCILLNRIKDNSYNKKVQIFQKNITDYVFDRKYNVIISKDVFHFLSMKQIESLMYEAKKNTVYGGWNYFVIFTDIKRNSTNNTKITIDGEANISKEEFINLAHKVYREWEIKINIEDYRELDKRKKVNEYYFIANKITLVSNKKKERDVFNSV